MKTLKLEINNKVYDKVLQLLRQFNPEDVKVIDEQAADKKYLSEELDQIDNGTADFVSMEELDKAMKERVLKYENKNP